MQRPLHLAHMLVTFSSVIACSSAGSPQTGAPSPAPEPAAQALATAAAACNAPVRGVDVSTWRLVTLKSFTYCVPPDWRGGGGSWRVGRTSLNAGTGAPRRQRVAVQRVEVLRPGQRPVPLDQPPGSDVRRFSEAIGGKPANLYRNHFNGTYYVGATWDTPAVWITAETPDADAADLVLQIARTVRFTGQ